MLVDLSSPEYAGEFACLDMDYVEIFERMFPYASKDIDQRLPKPLVNEMSITAFVDSDHAHDKDTQRSITGIIMFVGRTPIFYSSKRQGLIETST
jgi:hypothetical protein